MKMMAMDNDVYMIDIDHDIYHDKYKGDDHMEYMLQDRWYKFQDKDPNNDCEEQMKMEMEMEMKMKMDWKI